LNVIPRGSESLLPHPELFRKDRDFWLRNSPYCWQLNLEDRAPPYLTPHRDLAAVIADDATHDPEAKSGAFLAFGRHKWFKNCLLQVFRNSRTGIGNENANAAEREFFARAHMPGAQQQTPTIRHGIFR